MIGVDELHYSDFDAKTIAQIKEMLSKYSDDAEVYWVDDVSGNGRQHLQVVVREDDTDERTQLAIYKATLTLNGEWVGLTDEEVGTLTVFNGLHHIETPLLADFIRAIEAKLKEKNT